MWLLRSASRSPSILVLSPYLPGSQTIYRDPPPRGPTTRVPLLRAPDHIFPPESLTDVSDDRHKALDTARIPATVFLRVRRRGNEPPKPPFAAILATPLRSDFLSIHSNSNRFISYSHVLQHQRLLGSPIRRCSTGFRSPPPGSATRSRIHSTLVTAERRTPPRLS